MHKSKCGFVSIIGRANAGKSTLFNALINKNVSIVNRKAQTTRHLVRGVVSDEENASQIIFVDTPGLDTRNNKQLFNKKINNSYASTLREVDIVVWVVDRNHYTNADAVILKCINEISNLNLIVVVNKMDLMDNPNEILPFLTKLESQLKIKTIGIFPISSLTDENIQYLKKNIIKFLPESIWLYDKSQTSDTSEEFVASEAIRLQMLNCLNSNLPYASSVEIEEFEKEEGRIVIQANIYVETQSQKKIVIGEGGSKLKEIGERSRFDLQEKFNTKVSLFTFVKVKKNWRDVSSSLHSTTPY
jgi:GTP-binding protein Era